MAYHGEISLGPGIRALKQLGLKAFKQDWVIKNAKWTPRTKTCFLMKLSECLLDSDLTLTICSIFKGLILQLLYGARDLCKDSHELHCKFCVALSKIVLVYPHCIPFAVDYLSSHEPFFISVSNEPARKKVKRAESKKTSSSFPLDVCKASYTFLLANPEKFSDVYDWSSLSSFLDSTCSLTRWYAAQSLVIVNKISGADKRDILDKYFNREEQASCAVSLLNYEKDIRNFAIDDNTEVPMESDSDCTITTDDLHLELTLVCGIILPRMTVAAPQAMRKTVVVVPSTASALQNIAMAVSSAEPVILSGHIGAGKTCLVEYLAQLTNRHAQLVKVQLGEQIDSKTLLGTYCCTETPGQFVWRPGPLTTAVTNGQWLLLEDIDIAPMDVVSALLTLIETGTLPTNQGHSTKTKSGFQLFMTKRLHTAGSSASHSNCSLLEKAVMTVAIQPLTRTELASIINTLHPNLSKVVDRLLDMYFTLSSGKHVDDRPDMADIEMVKWTSFYGSRKLSTRDLLRWCQRISNDFQLISTDNEISVFQEALDCFCDSLTKPTQRLKLAEAIGTKINVTAEKANYYCNVHQPSIDLSQNALKIGRVSIERKHVSAADSLTRETHSRFAYTRQSCALLEKICVCVHHQEPVLLVGETGTGKTSLVQCLASQTGRNLTVINMNQQSDTTDLLGGYKPVMISRIISPLRDDFESLFCKTFSRKQNQTFLGHIQQCFAAKRWSDLLKLIEHTVKAALSKTLHLDLWKELHEKLCTVKLQVKYAKSALAFSFVEGALVKALKNGDWVLLDEINLATAETLDCLCGLLDTAEGSVTLIERGDAEPVQRHEEFRLFACMNPATDVGKKELTAGVRSRFTEFFVDELDSKAELRVMVNAYLSGLSLRPKQIDGIVNFYLAVKQEAAMKLTDGTGKRPTYSLRTLCRALSYAATNPYQAVLRSLYEAFSMSFLTQVDRSSHPTVTKLILQHIVGKENAKSILSKPMLPPVDVDCEKFEGYWLKKGLNKPMKDEHYILTDTVRANMKDVARVVACGRHPVLLQGETSVGKTSMIEYIAKASGNRCVRINNHEHTDVQEYTGSYVADEHGHLVFKEGILVDAMRNGYWIILDELNLAPTDVLEALNRLLDDNRELFIAETQTTVKAHPGFILFATQNPPGLYGGRKMLSRAFRNRFVELHFDEIPNSELEHILHKRCDMPLSGSKKIIKVMSELQLRRRDSGLFAGKQGYITLRDVFRWGERYRQSASEITDTFYDWDLLLAEQGFMLLAGRVRKPQEEHIIAEVLEKHFKRKVDPQKLFSPDSSYCQHALKKVETEDQELFRHIVWTYSLTRLAVLVGQAIKYNEPVLMVGDTGCGKTTICQYFAHLKQTELHTVNCHMHTEGSHFLGGLRPVRRSEMEVDDDEGGKLFEWQDGPLVTSMQTGSVLLVDEISLADDSVLERLNSVLEPSRTLVLAEKGGELETITAHPSFRMVATMNPAGDYGKKELSPALRNRFTEIWCPQTRDLNDYKLIINHNISSGVRMVDGSGRVVEFADAMVQFVEWFHNQQFGRRFTISIRDILAWVSFINGSLSGVASSQEKITPAEMYIHGACLVFLDALGSALVSDSMTAKKSCLDFLYGQVGTDSTSQMSGDCEVAVAGGRFTIGPFSIPLGDEDRVLHQYTLNAPSTSNNCLRLVRGLQLNKPILLEGSPGVGKTSLVTALAKASGHHIVRINLSQQTDISDLFGADLPVEGGTGGQFAWRDGLFLQALKLGHWIVLDELNLASQSVLEGLNACFDHRAEVFVPELAKTFHVQHEKVKIFACQNPLQQGGGRQGLPQSFLNRFTQVYIDEMESTDQEFIASSMYPGIPPHLIKNMVEISAQMVQQKLPGEYNLRDTFRWCELMVKYQSADAYSLAEHFSLLYVQPLRPSVSHCEKAYSIFKEVTGVDARHDVNTVRAFYLTDTHLLVGNMLMERKCCQPHNQSQACILHKQLPALESLATCMDMGWMAILDGPDCSGKSTLARILSDLVGEELKVFSMNSAMDTTDLLGGFEQADVMKSVGRLCDSVSSRLGSMVGPLLLKGPHASTQLMFALWRLGKETTSEGKLSAVEKVISYVEQSDVTPDIGELIMEWRAGISDLRTKIASATAMNGAFEWHDSVLVEAVGQGHWLLVENANICSASVLDRLNSLLEPNGSLTITERGVIDGQSVTITPHPNFRLILTANTQHTDLSRALKNRGVVISMASAQQMVFPSADDSKLYSLHGVTQEIAQVLKEEHDTLWAGRGQIGEQVMLERAKLYVSYRQRGFDIQQSLRASRSFYLYHSDRLNLTQVNSYDLQPATDKEKTTHVWTVGHMCPAPSLVMLDQLLCDVQQALSELTVAVPQSTVTTVVLERLSPDQLLLLNLLLPSHQLIVGNVDDFLITSAGLIQAIAHAVKEICAVGLPMDLRWLSDVWLKVLRASDHTQTLTCLLNTWSISLVSRQLQVDVEDLPANSWCALSSRVHQGLLDAKHLPNKVVLHYQPLADAVHSLIQTVTCQQHGVSSFTDDNLSRMLPLLEFVRRFLISDNIVSATLSWSWLEQSITDILTVLSCQELSLTVSRIHLLLAEGSTNSKLFNEMWNSFPHLPPINCQSGSSDSNRGEGQLTVLLQKTIDSLSPYNKVEGEERQTLIKYLSSQESSSFNSVVCRCVNALYSDCEVEEIAECLLALSNITPRNVAEDVSPSSVVKLWPLREHWLLRSVLRCLGGEESQQLLDTLQAYDGSASLLPLTITINMLADQPDCQMLFLNMICEWADAMCHSSAFTAGQPFIQCPGGDNQLQLNSSFGSSSLFKVISHLLSDDLSNKQTESNEDHRDLSPHSVSPSVCVGRYKDKLNQLALVCKELWQHASLLDGCGASEEERRVQAAHEKILLHADHLPDEVRSHPLIQPVIEKLANMGHISTAERWIWLGLVQAVSTAPRGVLDPVVKGNTELMFVNDEISRVETEIAVRQKLVWVQCGKKLEALDTHPYYSYLCSRLEQLHNRKEELQERSVQRPTNEQFADLVSDVKGLLSNTLRHDYLQELVAGLQGKEHAKFLARERMLHSSLTNYMRKVVSTYPLYVDCHQPHVNGIKLICYGLKKLVCLSTASSDMVRQSLTGMMSSPEQLYNSLETCAEGLDLVRTLCKEAELPAESWAPVSSQYLRLHVASLANQAYNSSRLDCGLMSKMSTLMGHYVGLWQADNAKREEREQEAESLYSFKQHGQEAESDEQQLDKLTQQSFPSFIQEFADLVPSDTLGDSTEETTPTKEVQQDVDVTLSEQDMVAITELHCNIILSLAATDWYKGDNSTQLSTQRAAAHTSLLNIVHQLVSAVHGNPGAASESITGGLVHLHLVSAGLMSGECLGKHLIPSDKPQHARYDIYKDENVAEAVRCMEPLSVVRGRINELLADWPEHPLLLQIIGICERIESFLVTEPLMKFTAGLELVLEKLQEWETNAARHVSVQSAMNAVSQLIIEWRKMELDGWRQSLDGVADKMRLNATKYWFHLCSVMLPYLHPRQSSEEGPSAEELSDLVVQYLESSAIGDFCYRLRLLQVFTLHMGHVADPRATSALNSLCSILEFYKQFEVPLKEHISKKRSGLEKELKNFVKISRWNDVNFWSVRASVDKAHKTVAKHMRAYSEILACPASKLFTEDVSQLPSVAEVSEEVPEGSPATPCIPVTVDLHLDNPGSLECLPRLSHLTSRFYSACGNVNSKLPIMAGRAEAINSFTRELVETVTELQGLTIISGDDKEKQRKQAKNIDMRKRKSLADLLNTLNKIGLSYRKGSVKLQTSSANNNNILRSHAASPFNLQIVCRDVSKEWVEVWQSAVKYMLRTITRRSVFLDASTKPSKELGVDIIQKLKGYSEHMVDLLRDQHVSLSGHTLSWSRCREQVLAIQRLDTQEQVPLSNDVHHVTCQLSSAIPGMTEHLEELKLLLLSAPADGVTVPSPCPADTLPPACHVTLYSDTWNKLIGQVNDSLGTMSTSCTYLSSIADERVRLYNRSDLRLVSEHVQQLTAVCDRLFDFLAHFKSANGKLVMVSQVQKALQSFTNLLRSCKARLNSTDGDTPSLSSTDFNLAMDRTLRGVLLACQHTIARFDSEAVDDEDIDVLMNGHLKETMKQEEITLTQLSLNSIGEGLSKLTSDVSSDPDPVSRQQKASILLASAPLLHQFMWMSEMLLTQSWTSHNNSVKLLSILYNIFTHLASKGFCLPEELADEDGEGQGDFHTTEGTGLAEGQGAKDVSDQIENEDDLDDAKRPEDREKEEETPDEAPPPEDNAIEMSEDFDGAMEDAPTTEVDEEDENASSGDEDEMDDKMGDIGNSDLNEKLDDKLWGEDGKDDEEEQSKEEETGKGSEETKKEMVAKDDNPEETTPNKEETQTEVDEEKEMNEMEEKAEEFNQEEKPDPYYDGDKAKEPEGDNPEFDMPDNMELDEVEEGDEMKEGDEMEEPVAEQSGDEMDEEKGEDKQEQSTFEQEADDPEEPETGEGEKEEPTIGEMEPEGTKDEETEQQNMESYGATAQAADEQIVEEAALDKGGETESKEEQGAGQSESNAQQEAGLGESYQTGSAEEQDRKEQSSLDSKEQRSSNEERVLGDTEKNYSMDLDAEQSSTNRQPQKHQQPPTSTLYEHITPDQQETADAQAMDAANEQQLDEQQKAEEMDTEQSELKVHEETTKKQIEEVPPPQLKPAELAEKLAKSRSESDRVDEKVDELTEEEMDEISSEKEEVGHGNTESTIHTDMEMLQLTHQEVEELKQDLEEKVSGWSEAAENDISESEAREAWEKYDAVTKTLSHELCEQLRLILEPTQAAKLRGDYRTGKRLNMRKVIAYIASQFRKDNIWLRRTEPSKREYQIAVAVDDSSSMVDNHSKQLAFEALACISNALTYLQAGDMAIASFGEDVKMVHDFSSQFTWDDGGNVLRNFSFRQKKTRVAQMLNSMTTKFLSLRRSGGSSRHEMAQLLMIVSDGRGLFLEGVDTVKQAVRRALNSGIFLVFVIIDNPSSKDSILDIKMPVFSATGPPQINSYMDSFPFPFYVILRDINSLPHTLGDALRQWFELVTSQS